MIGAAIIGFFQAILAGILSVLQLLPDAPPQIDTAFTWLGTQLGAVNTLFPVADVLSVLSIVIAVEAGIMLWSVLILIAGFIRGGH